MKSIQPVQALSALAQESRLEVFRLLVRCGEEGMPAGQIAQRVGIPSATLSFHLKELSNAGLIEQRREGRSLIYSVEFQGMRSLLAYLMQDCCQGRPELCQVDYRDAECGEKTQERPKRKKGRKTAGMIK